MCSIAQIRALITTLVLASYSPLAIAHGPDAMAHTGHLAISLFVARRTRVAASQQFDVANRVCVAPRARLAPTNHAPPDDSAARMPAA